jgi:hypothetical protein
MANCALAAPTVDTPFTGVALVEEWLIGLGAISHELFIFLGLHNHQETALV